MTTPDDPTSQERQYRRSRGALRTVGLVLFGLVALGAIGYLAATQPVSHAAVEASFRKLTPVHGIPTTAEDFDALTVKPDDQAADCIKVLSRPVSRSDRSDLVYFLRHGATDGDAAFLLQSMGRELQAARTLFATPKPFNFIDWRKSMATSSARAGSIAFGAQLLSLEAIAKAKEGDTDTSLLYLSNMARFFAEMPPGTTALEVLHRGAQTRQLAVVAVRATESRPGDTAFRLRLINSVVNAWHSPEAPDVARSEVSLTLLFGRQLAGSTGTEFESPTITRFNERWSYVPKAMQAVMLEGAVQEVNRRQLQTLATIEQGWKEDRNLADKLDDAQAKPAFGVVTMQQAYQDLLLDQGTVGNKTLLVGLKNTEVVRDLVRAYLEYLDDPRKPLTATDWYSGKPFAYRASPLAIWSVGPDLTDNSGASWDMNSGVVGPRPPRYDIVLAIDRYGRAQITGA